jgi:hypothetical protein
LFVPAIADILGHRNPSLVGWIAAFASVLVVLFSDFAYKLRRRAK